MNNHKRGAGILLHITSLPSPFGIGDMGPGAKSFADFLHRSGQQYWQLLPLNPTEAGQGNSPYSSISSRAGNTLLISPELLFKDGLLDDIELDRYHVHQTAKADFEAAEKIKQFLFDIAWNNFKNGKAKHLTEPFEQFCKKESYWLDDFVRYTQLKKQFSGLPWYEWTDIVALPSTVETLTSTNFQTSGESEAIAFLQFLFSKQFHELKEYCNNLDIKLFGDLPFYPSYDSVDVWTNKDIFSLNADGEMEGIAGVPPDAFSDEGQFWGMPVFRWDVLQQRGYDWWIARIKKNMELYDMLRLDHFRAFADYWEIPAWSDTAKNGEWKLGPGAALFLAIKKALGDLPFIAEDLGEINELVHELRNQFDLPGMKILQFAFGYGMPSSNYIPHNYTSNFVVYTGTHDNNTICGWYRQEGKQHHYQLEKYFGIPLSEKNIHLVMGRLAYASVANLAILPMQDVLGLDENARMNIPGSPTENWLWRLLPDQITTDVEVRLKEWVELYNR